MVGNLPAHSVFSLALYLAANSGETVFGTVISPPPKPPSGNLSITSYGKVYKTLNGCIGFHEVNELNTWGDDVCGVYQDTIMDLWSDRGGHLHEYHENMFYMKAQPPFGNYYYDDLEGVMKGFFPCFTTAERVTAEEAALDRFAELCPGH
ncbi:MAG: hypothetical protein FWG99_05370 [Treponema sp.]|nr:hypothetical protein [Treponema sp.]